MTRGCLGMNLQALLGDVSVRAFVTDYYQRLPYSVAGLARSFCELGTWDSLASILMQEGADVLVCRRNEQYTGPIPRGDVDAKRLVGEGFTLLARHAEQHDERLAKVAVTFSRDFAA